MKIKVETHRTGPNSWDVATTTVGELVSALLQMPQDALVYTEGCDCIGEVAEVELRKDGSVEICRP